MRKKILSSFLSLILVVSIFSACGDTTDESESSGANNTSSVTSEDKEEIGFKDISTNT